MLKRFKYRLYPTETQKVLINKHIGACRFVYNLALETKNMAYLGSKHVLSPIDLNSHLPSLKEECTWLKEVNAQSLQQSIFNMDVAFKRFFKGFGFPKFKSKHGSKQSFPIPQRVVVRDNRLVIPKFQEGIRMTLHRPINGLIKQASISMTPTGKYFASILCENGELVPSKPLIRHKTTIGVDVGVKYFAVTSSGEVFENPKFLKKAQKKLKFVHSRYDRFKGKRTKQRLALLHEKVANQRKDFLHKTSFKLIRENQTICLEDLNVKGMLKNHNLAQAISDCGWGEFVRQLEYKAEWYGKNVIKIGRFAPSSKACSDCGKINKELNLSDREWTCSCGATHDRDVNAAINIKAFALKKLSGEHTLKNHGELPTLVGVLTHEA